MRKKLVQIATWLQPTIIASGERKFSDIVVSISRLIAALPFAVVALVWLVTQTDFRTILQPQPLVVLLLALCFALIAFPLWIPEDTETALFARVSFAPLIYFSALLIWDVPGIWLIPVTTALYLVWQLLSGPRQRIAYIYQALNEFAAFGLAALTAREIFLQLGGSLPFSGWRAEPAAALGAATAVWLLFPFLYAAIQQLFVTGRFSWSDLRRNRQHHLIALILQFSITLFAIYAADLYRQNSTTYPIFLTGALLMSFLANRIHARVVQHMEREYALALVADLSRQVLEPGEEQITLRGALHDIMPLLFPHSQGEVRIFPNEILYASNTEQEDPLDAIWPQAVDGNHATPARFLQGENGRAWDAFLVAIPDLEGDEPLGAIGLSRPQRHGPIKSWIPPAEELAAQIAAILQRDRLHQRALEQQAKAYQDEVISQAYEAEYYAQSLAYEKMNKELVIAGQIQSSFLPVGVPDLPGWQLAVTLEPARQTSGDFYDFMQLEDGRLGFLVADVADKGIGPALYMALSRTLIRTYALQYDREPHKALAAANQRILQDTHSDLFVTVFYGVLDPVSGLLRYCNAGHNPPYLFTADDRQPICPLTRTALPLGLFDDQPWEQGEIQVAPGDLLLLYTDGIVEAQDDDGGFFGENYLQELGRYCRLKSAAFTQEKIVDAVYDFIGAAEQADDMTLMVLKRQHK